MIDIQVIALFVVGFTGGAQLAVGNPERAIVHVFFGLLIALSIHCFGVSGHKDKGDYYD